MIYLVPLGCEGKHPLTISGKTVRGGGSYNDDSKYTLDNCNYDKLGVLPKMTLIFIVELEFFLYLEY